MKHERKDNRTVGTMGSDMLQNGRGNPRPSADARPARAGAWRITAVYATVALLWILTSDEIAHTVTGSFLSERAIQSLKGIGFVLVTSALLWWLAYRHLADISESRAHLALVQETMPIACIVLDRDLVFKDWNHGAERIFGYGKSEILGKTPDGLGLSPYPDGYIKDLRELIRSQQLSSSAEFCIHENTVRDGRRILCEWRHTLLIDDADEFIGILAMAQDVTERERNKAELAQHREHLEDLVRQRTSEVEAAIRELRQLEDLRDNLMHMIVHDMRSPLQVIIGNLELIKMGPKPLDSETFKYLCAVETGANRLLQSISDLLDVRKLETNQMPLTRTAVDLGMLTTQVIDELKAVSISHTIVFEPSTPPVVTSGDSALLRRVIANLIENALKYTPTNTAIRISLAGANQTAVWAISDNGPGIPVEYQSRVFDLFNHVPAVKNQKAVSSGVGLAFCKLAIEAHAGTIVLESEPGKGSTFRIHLPLA